jgi:hypothetical protein
MSAISHSDQADRIGRDLLGRRSGSRPVQFGGTIESMKPGKKPFTAQARRKSYTISRSTPRCGR